MIVNKIPAVGDMSGQPWEFRLSGVRALRSGRGIIQQLSGNWETIVTAAEQAASNYTVDQSYAYVITENGVFVKSGTFTVVSITLVGSNYDMVVSIADLDSSDFYTIYPATNNTTLLTSINVSIKDTDTDVETDFEFPVTTAGECGFYLGKFINDLVKAKGLVIPNVATPFARAGRYEITVNGVPFDYRIAYGGRFNKNAQSLNSRNLSPLTKVFKRLGTFGNDSYIFSKYFETGGTIQITDFAYTFETSESGLKTISIVGIENKVLIIDTCNSSDYQLKALQIGFETFDITYPIVRFLNQIGGVEEAWANGNNQLNLNQGDAAYSQSILGSVQLVGRKDSYQSMQLNFVPIKYLNDKRDVEAEINRLQAIRLSDYVELRLQNQSGVWKSIQVQVEPDSANIASNRDNQNNATVTLNVTFANPL